jgi:PAS domain S-box-containing protein
MGITMKDEPNIVKELREIERLGMLKSKVQSAYEMLETVEEIPEENANKTVESADDYVDSGKETGAVSEENRKACSQDIENKYRLIAETTSDLICTTTFKMNPKYTYINPSYKRILGYSPEDMMGKSLWDFIHPDDKKKLLTIFKKYIGMKDKKLLIRKEATICENFASCIKDKSGKWHHLKSVANIIGDELLFVSKDFTDCKETEHVFKEAESYLRTILSNAPVTIFAIDDQGLFTLSEGKILDKVGLKSGENVGVSASELYGTTYFTEYNGRQTTGKNVIHRVFAGETVNAINELHGVYFDNHIGPIRDAEGKVVGIVGVAIDITERKQAEKALAESEGKLRRVIDSSPDNITISDLNGNILDCNQATVDMHGFTKKEDIIGKNALELIAPKDHEKAIEHLKKTIELGSVKNVEYSFLKKDGSEFPAEISASVIIDFSGKPVSFVGVIKDITERRKAEEALKESESRNRAILNAIPDIMFVLGRDGTFLDYQTTNPNSLFISPEQFLNGKIQDVLPEEIASKSLDLIEQAIATGKMQVFEYQMPNADQNLYFEARIMPYSNDKVFSIIRDITDRKNAEKKIREINDIINESPVVAFLWRNTEGWPVEFVSKNVKKLFGYYTEDFTSGRVSFADTVYPDDLKRVSREVEKYSKEKTKKEFTQKYRIITKNKKIKWIEDRTFIRRDENANITHYQVIVWDIAESKKMEDALKSSMKRYQELIEGSHDGYIMTDMEDKIIEYNTTFKNMTGYTEKELKNKKLGELSPEEWHKKIDEINRQVLKNGYSEIYEKEIIRKDGRIIPVELRKYLVRGDAKPMGLWSFVRDITERKRSEDEVSEKIKILEKYKNLTIGRELRIIELKEKVKKLEKKLEERKK